MVRTMSMPVRAAAVSVIGMLAVATAAQPAGAAESLWTVVPTPSPGALANSLRGVASVGPADVWSVGDWQAADGWERTLTQHWDGSRWRTVDSPNLKAPHNTLAGVDGTAPADVWAVGHATANRDDPDGLDEATLLILHGDGTSWSLAPVDAPGTASALAAVDMLDADDGWAVGSYRPVGGATRQGLIMHWDGLTWRKADAPDLGTLPYQLTSVSGTGADDVWAVGHTDRVGGKESAVILHWDGQAWHRTVPAETGGRTALFGVYAASGGDVWAVGYVRPDGADEAGMQAYALRWSGAAWQRVVVPAMAGVQLHGVVAVPAGVWAVGYQGGANRDNEFALAFDGTGMRVEPLPGLPGTTGNVTGTALAAVTATVGTGRLWIVGWQTAGCLSCPGRLTRVLSRTPA